MSQPIPETGVPTCYRHPDRETYIRCQRCERPICPDCMRDAAVGFQCVECVKAGAKQTRSGRTAYGGLRPADASATSIGLIALNVAVWIAVVATGWRDSRLIDLLALVPQGRCEAGGGYFPGVDEAGCSLVGGTYVDGVASGAYWQVATVMFTQIEVWHIAFNMLALWVLGPQLELAVGRARFLFLYFISGLAGSALVLWAADPQGSTVGASGAIFGLMGALLVLAYKVGGDVRGILTWIGINFVITLVLVSNISWQGHVGGFVGGLACAGVIIYAPRGPQRARVQAAGLTAIAAVVLVAITVRTVMLG